jgi:hypothetical protein
MSHFFTFVASGIGKENAAGTKFMADIIKQNTHLEIIY